MAASLLAMRHASKSFFGNTVLSGVDLDLYPGEVHPVVGENGAGKSTLMKILAGVHRPDSGSITLDGVEVSFDHPRAAQAAGIAIIYQELTLLGERPVAENVFLGREPVRFGVVDRRRMEAETARLLDELGETSFTARTRVRALSVAQQQVVEIAKALVVDARIVVMDEPTASLADHEVELLYKLVQRLRARGIGVLYVSHRLREVFDLSQRVTVLKDGLLVSTVDTSSIDVAGLVRLEVRGGCTGGTNQQWTRVGNTFRALGKCLDVNGAGTADGTIVQLWTCNGTAAQNWTPQADGSLVNPTSAKCLDAFGASSANGTQLIIWTCHGGANQKWTVPAATNPQPPLKPVN